jgi:hypothetical protein
MVISFDQQYNRYRVSVSKTSQEHKSPFQGIGCIHRHESQFKMTVYRCQIHRNLWFMLCNQDLNLIALFKFKLVFSFQI